MKTESVIPDRTSNSGLQQLESRAYEPMTTGQQMSDLLALEQQHDG